MKSLLVLVVRPAAVVLAVIVGAFAAARVPSLAGFVLGAVLAGASILLLTVRGVGIRRRPVPAVSLRYDRPAWSHPYVAGAAEPGPVAGKKSYAPRHAA
jgi:hypothetical protein